MHVIHALRRHLGMRPEIVLANPVDDGQLFVVARHCPTATELREIRVNWESECAPMHFMPEIRVPTMVLAACDDPWIPIDHYRTFKWSDNPWLLPVMTETGGHVGFHGDASGRPWCNIAIEKFLAQVTKIEA